MYPFERFTETSKQVLTLAQDEAEKSHHSYIGTEHLLLGLISGDDLRTTETFSLLGIEIEQVRATIESVLGRNERIIVQQIIPTSRVNAGQKGDRAGLRGGRAARGHVCRPRAHPARADSRG